MAISFEGGLLAASLHSQYQFTVHRSVTGQFYFTYHDKRAALESICWSETYPTRETCLNAIETVRNRAATAELVDRS